MSLARLAICMGDPGGIGPEVALKAALDARLTKHCKVLLVGDATAMAMQARACGIDHAFLVYEDASAVDWDRDGLRLLQIRPGLAEPPVLGEIRAEHGRAAVASARLAVQAALQGKIDAVVAAPQTELAIARAGIAFDGYPTLVAQCTGTPKEDVFLMLCFDRMRIAHVSLHVSLRQAIALITEARVFDCIGATQRSLAAMGNATPRIAVSGLNPHAGEGGLFGDEETRIIAPAIARARSQGIDAHGPFGADTMFQRTGFDAFVVMVHDQGHITAKLLGENRTAALTIGTPVRFSSVAHGSALDIAGKNLASPEAVVEAALRLCGASPSGR